MEEAFKKFDSDKERLSILPTKALREVTKVMMHGAKKYGVNNWKRCPPDERYRYYDALLRHLYSDIEGEKIDPETKLLHLAHIACNVLFLLELELEDSNVALDLRYKQLKNRLNVNDE